MNHEVKTEQIMQDIALYLEENLDFSDIRDRISIDTNLYWDMGLTSIDYMQLISGLEEKYSITFSVGDMEIKGTIGEIVEYVLKQAEKSDGME